MLKYDKRIKKSEIGPDVSRIWNERITKILEKFVEICEKNNLRYILSYGSVIGAVRHKGIIPWDDDIDVAMPQPDYDKFLDICKKIDLGDYELFTPEETPGFYAFNALLVDKNSSLMLWRKHLCVLGLFLDIFPISGISKGREMRSKLFYKMCDYQDYLLAVSSKYDRRTLYNIWCNKKFRRFFSAIICSLNRNFFRKWILQKAKQIRTKYEYENSEYVVNYTPVYGEKQIFPKKWIEETILVDFENLKVRIPKDYDAYLKHFYGDYMKLPPEEERDDRHEFDYLNFNERKSRSEILEIIKKEGR